MKIRFKGKSRSEWMMRGEDKFLIFEWVRLSKDNYIVYIPPIFRKQTGGNLIIISEKKMMKMLNDFAKTQKDIEKSKLNVANL